MELLPSTRSVYLNMGRIKGKYRTPENIVFLVGEDNPIVENYNKKHLKNLNESKEKRMSSGVNIGDVSERGND